MLVTMDNHRSESNILRVLGMSMQSIVITIENVLENYQIHWAFLEHVQSTYRATEYIQVPG